MLIVKSLKKYCVIIIRRPLAMNVIRLFQISYIYRQMSIDLKMFKSNSEVRLIRFSSNTSFGLVTKFAYFFLIC